MKKLFALIMSVLMIACFMPTMAFAADETAPTGYGGDTLPQGPDMSGTVVNVNASNAQYTLDGAYGSINGKTINFTENIEEILHIGRPTKYAGSNTEYFVGGFTSEAENYQKFSTAEDLTKFYKQNPYPSRCYNRTISNVTLTSNEGITLAGFDMLDATGHVYQTRADSYEWVQDRAIVNGTNDGYYGSINIDGLTFEGLNINNTSIEDVYAIQFDITSVSNKQNVLRNITFKNCKISKTCDSSKTIAGATHFMNNGGTADLYENITFDGCDIKVTGDTTHRYGVFALGICNLTVNNCTLDGMTRAVQTQAGGNQNEKGTLIVTNNLFKNTTTYTVKVAKTEDITGLTITGNRSENSTSDCKVKIEPKEEYKGSGEVTICKNEWDTNVGYETGYDWNKDVPAVAQIDNIYYTSLQAAVDAAADKATIKLLSDVQLSTPIDVNKNVTVDLNGKTISAADDFNDDTYDYIFGVKRGAELTINDSEGNGTIDGAKVLCGVKLTLYGEGADGENACLNVNGGTIIGKEYGISGNGTRQGTVINLNGGTVKASDTEKGIAIYHPQRGTLTITNGTLEANTALVVKSGTLTISGGTIKATGEKKEFNHNGNGFYNTGDALVIEACDYPGGVPVVVNISGGAFTSAKANAVAYYKQNEEYDIVNKKFITGGTFSSDPTAYAADNYKAKQNADGTWTVKSASSSGGGSSSRQTPLDKAKAEANAAISTAASANKYEEAEQAEVKNIVDKAAADIKNAKTEEEVKAIQEAAQAEIDKILTAEEKAQIGSAGAVDKEIFKAKSKYSKLRGKKAIKVTWNVPNGMKLDGYEVFRSTKKFSGYGKTPYFTTTNTSYINNKDLVRGKTYYYKVRGFVEINGERYYTGFSTKAFRTVK